MSFLSKLFGLGNSLEAIRKSAQQGRSADVLARAADLDTGKLSTAELEELQALKQAASESLAQLNLDEGLACLNAGELQRGVEHLELVLQLTNSDKLRSAAEQALTAAGKELPVTVATPAVAAASCSSSCCDHGATTEMGDDHENFDEDIRFDLILTAYPEAERVRYRALAADMRRGVLLAHEGSSDEALAILQQTPEAQRDDLYFYEIGALYARCNRVTDAVKALRRALEHNPGHELARETLIDLLLTSRAFDAAEELLQPLLAAGIATQYCHARLAFLWQARGDESQAFTHAGEAIRLGYREPQMLVFYAGVLEREKKLDDAESVLQLIPTTGGCSGGANVDLAEFWLRHQMQLQKALEMFKKAAKGDVGNPLWGLRIAQTYLALGWKRDALTILETLAGSDMVTIEVRQQAKQLLHATK